MSSYHNISSLITEDDLCVVLSLIEEGCKIISSAVVRLYFLDNNLWTFYDTGVILLVQNFNEKRFYMEFCDIDSRTKMFTEKIGKSLQYNIYDNNLHIIVSGSSCILLCIADLDTGWEFSNSMNKLIKLKTEKESLEKSLTISQKEKCYMPLSDESKLCKVELVKDGKRKFRHSKSDVGLPYNVRHIDHIGQNGFFLGEISHSQLKNYLCEIDMEFLIDKEIDRPSDDISVISGSNFLNIKSSNSNKKFYKKISKKDIGDPENFVHMQHCGMNDSNNFDLGEEFSNIFSKEEIDDVAENKIIHHQEMSENKIGRMKISKSDISIPSNFRHIEHFGDKNPIPDDEDGDGNKLKENI